MADTPGRTAPHDRPQPIRSPRSSCRAPTVVSAADVDTVSALASKQCRTSGTALIASGVERDPVCGIEQVSGVDHDAVRMQPKAVGGTRSHRDDPDPTLVTVGR